MSLPVFNPQTHLFGLQAVHREVFEPEDRYRLLAERIYPLLVQARAPLERCYPSDTGRAAIEPVLLLGVSSERGRIFAIYYWDWAWRKPSAKSLSPHLFFEPTDGDKNSPR